MGFLARLACLAVALALAPGGCAKPVSDAAAVRHAPSAMIGDGGGAGGGGGGGGM